MVKSCGSSYVQYNRIMRDHYSNHHCGCFGSVFTTPHCCGGFGISGGFWGGVGAGLGIGVSNLLMSSIGLLGNWLMCGISTGNWSFNMGNYGLNMGNYGGGFGNYNSGNYGFWGLNGTNGTTGKSGKSSGSKSTSGTTGNTKTETVTVEKEVIKTNTDAKTIADLGTRLGNILEKINKGEQVTQAEIDQLTTDINAIDINNLDKIDDEIDRQNIETLKKSLPKLKPTIKANLAKILANAEPTEEDIRSLIINFATLTDDQKTELKTKVENKVKDLKNEDNTYQPAKKNYSQWLYLELLGKLDPNLVVKVENFDDASDKWIKGRPYSVQKDDNGNVGYWIDCAKTGDRIKACWKFVTVDENTVEIRGTEATEDTCDVYNARIGMKYNWDDTKKCYINNNGKYTAN